MSKWCVYVNASHTPYMQTVEAESAEAAARTLRDFDDTPMLVFPQSALAFQNFDPVTGDLPGDA